MVPRRRCSKEDAGTIFHDASYMNMTGRGYVWVVTEQALIANHVPPGAIGLKLVNASDEDAHITDSLWVFTCRCPQHLYHWR